VHQLTESKIHNKYYQSVLRHFCWLQELTNNTKYFRSAGDMAHIWIGYFTNENYMHQNRCILLNALTSIVYSYKDCFYSPLWLNKINCTAFFLHQNAFIGSTVTSNNMY